MVAISIVDGVSELLQVLRHCHGCFSNRPFRVKRFQTIHHRSVDVAHGLVLLFGIGTRPLYGAFFVKEFARAVNLLSFVSFLFDLEDCFFTRPALRPRRCAVKLGLRTKVAACSAFPSHTLTASRAMAPR